MKNVVSVNLMRKCEQATIKNGLSSKELMNKAAQSVLESYPFKGNIAIVCGTGNNAGDGYALALKLKEQGCKPVLFLIEESFSKDGSYYFQLCQKHHISVNFCNNKTSFTGYDAIVDAIYGIGFIGEVKKSIKTLIQKINESKSPVISIDINSGIMADNGLGDICVKSDLTVAIEYLKLGHFLAKARDNISKIIVKQIGIDLIEKPYYLVEKEDVASLFPKRNFFSNKGDYGKSVLIGGSRQYCGAIQLASMSLSSLKVGTGISILAIPESIYETVAAHTLEVILHPITEKNGFMIYNEQILEDLITKASSIGIGPGWGRGVEYSKILEYIILNSKVPIIIDADGLNTLAAMDLNILIQKSCPIILTPHPREFSRLIQKSVKEILENPIPLAKEFAKKYHILLLLKGTTTIVTDGIDVHLVNKGTPGMATAGSGDVLTGILTGLCSYMEANILTVSSGAYINGLAGELANCEINDYSMIASDTVYYIPKALDTIINSNNNK